MNKHLLIIVFLFGLTSLMAQKRMSFEQYEKELQNKFIELTKVKLDTSQRAFKNQTIKVVKETSVVTDSLRHEINNQIIELFTKVLRKRKSFDYPFNKLNKVSKLISEDQRIRVISWNIPKEDGTYAYFCFIQQLDKKKAKLKLTKLKDNSDKIENPEFARTNKNKWYGALYYKIITNKSGKKTYYTLLGWDGNNNFTNKKIVETFYIEGNKLVLGPPVFRMGKDLKTRLIFEYAKQAKMMLRYDDEIDMIVYDHLAPSHRKFKGQYMYYGPDMSQDGIKFEKGFWTLKPNLDLRNKNQK